MTPHWKAIKQVFAEVEALPEEARAAFLADLSDRAVAEEVAALLEHASPEGSTLREVVVEAAEALRTTSDAEGQMLGAYRLVRELGRGGMGLVWLAERADAQFDKRVAIKLLRPASGARSRERFLTERRILATLEHPNIARLLDGGETDDGVPYVVMEYVDGETIDRYCARHALPADERVRLCRDVCLAVELAHRNLVVHRDIKPRNVLVDADGVPKLLDFGIAKVLTDDDAAATKTGLRPMTPEYASPEQVRGQRVTTATDVYALGGLLYEMLAGRSAFAGSRDDPWVLARAICEEEPTRPSVVARQAPPREPPLPTVDRDLDNIVLVAMHKEPTQRYRSAAELADDLDRFLERRPVQARPSSLAYRLERLYARHRWPVIAGVVTIVLLLASGGFSVLQMRSAIDANARLVRETRIAVSQARRASLETARLHLDHGDLSAAQEILEGFEPDRRDWTWRQLASSLDRSIALVPLDEPVQARLDEAGTRIVALLASGTVQWWSPFRPALVASHELGGSVTAADLDRLGTRAVTTDGREVASWAWSAEDGVTRLSTRTLDEPVLDVAMSADGRRVAVLTATRFVLGGVDGDDGFDVAHHMSPRAVELGVDGAHVGLVAEGGRRMAIYDVDQGRFTRAANDASSLGFAPDGKRLVAGRLGGSVALRGVAQVGNLTQYLGHRGEVRSVRVDPTGRWAASGSADRTVRIVDLDGVDAPRLLVGHEHSVRQVAFSGDGRRVLSVDDAGVARLWPRDGRVQRRWQSIRAGGALALDLSPDTQRLILVSRAGSVRLVDVESFEPYDVRETHPLFPSAFAASPDGLHYATADGSGVTVRAVRNPALARRMPDAPGDLVGLAYGGPSQLAGLGEDGRLWIWDPTTGERRLERAGPAPAPRGAVVFAADGRSLATAHDGVVVVWDEGVGRPVQVEPGAVPHALAFSPESDRLAAGWSDGRVRVGEPR
ncbi:MAG: WD40 repeat domain-containing serine/threonine-protein kinase, partial [Myxococcota bacterium]